MGCGTYIALLARSVGHSQQRAVLPNTQHDLCTEAVATITASSASKSFTARPSHSAAWPNGVFGISHTRGADRVPRKLTAKCRGSAGNAGIDRDRNRWHAVSIRRCTSSAAASLVSLIDKQSYADDAPHLPHDV